MPTENAQFDRSQPSRRRMCARMLLSFALGMGSLGICGCGWFRPNPAEGVPLDQQTGAVQNPLFIPVTDRDFAWNQISDAVDNFFRIEREQPVRLVGGILTEGRIDTYPLTGSTIFEPWRTDSTAGYERRLATLQSIRRRAIVQVAPAEGGYMVQVTVLKELEHVDRSDHATVGNATTRHNNEVQQAENRPGQKGPLVLGWISLGRDAALENRILSDIHSRLLENGQPVRLP